MLSLAWAEGSPWAGGDQSGGDITPAGRDLIAHLDALGIIHDVSHLSERAFWTLLDLARGPVVASHSNCRALLPGAKFPDRHLSDDQIRALAQRPHAKIGINLFARFLIPPEELAKRRATSHDVLAHMQHIAQVANRRDILALGSDADSGFGADLLPADVQGHAQLGHLADALQQAGWTEPEVTTFATGWEQVPGAKI
jgi:membrane dipeptidase